MDRLVKRHLEDIMNRTGHGFIVLDDKLMVIMANTRACEYAEYNSGTPIGVYIKDVLPKNSKLLPLIKKVIKTREQITKDFYTRHNPGHWLHLEIFMADNRVCLMFRDITEQHRTQVALRESQQQALLFANSIPQLAWMSEPNGNAVWFNKRWYDFTGSNKRSMIGWGWRKVVHPDHLDSILEKIQASYLTGKAWELIFPLMRRDGTYRWFLCKAVPQLDRHGSVVRWFGTNTDVTEQREDDIRQQVMLDELDHRVKNLMTTIQSIARNTMRNSRDLGHFDTVFTDRLMALNATNDLLTQHRWTGASLQEILELEAAPYNEGNKRFTIKGPEVLYGPKTVISVSMAFHELVTNAVKYGALSNDVGHVSVTWVIKKTDKGDRLNLVWMERGGPKVKTPSRKGFGTDLVQKILAPELNGTVDIQYKPSGIVCLMDLSSVGTRD